MRIDELTSVKRYQNSSFRNVLRDFESAGGQIDSGRHGTVLSHPKWSYVFKTFPDDQYYLRFVRWAKRNQQLSALPRILGGPWRMVPFYARPANGPAKVYVVKLERLHPITDKALGDLIIEWVENGMLYLDKLDDPEALAGVAEYHRDNAEYERVKALPRTDPDRRAQYAAATRNRYDSSEWRRLSDFIDALRSYPALKPLCEAYRVFNATNLAGAPDVHRKNFMQRDDGSLVMIDPLWAGETPYQAHDRMMQAEYYDNDDEPEPEDEYNTIPGGKLHAKKRPKPKSGVQPPMTSDFPF